MKLLVITFSTDNTNPGLHHLINSLKKFGYDYHVLQGPEFSWDGNNYPHIANWLKANRKDYTHILYTDAWDTLAMGPLSEIEQLQIPDNIWISSGEKNCYPRSDWSPRFGSNGRWKYLNAGGYLTSIDLYIHIVEKEIREAGKDDQEWSSSIFLSNDYPMRIDTGCVIFQTLYHELADEFAWTRDGRLYNRINNTYPVFVHGNGKVDMRWIYHPPASPFYRE